MLDVTNYIILQNEQGKESQNQTKSREYKLIAYKCLTFCKTQPQLFKNCKNWTNRQ